MSNFPTGPFGCPDLEEGRLGGQGEALVTGHRGFVSKVAVRRAGHTSDPVDVLKQQLREAFYPRAREGCKRCPGGMVFGIMVFCRILGFAKGSGMGQNLETWSPANSCQGEYQLEDAYEGILLGGEAFQWGLWNVYTKCHL